jgi:Tol biopolymer transport system component
VIAHDVGEFMRTHSVLIWFLLILLMSGCRDSNRDKPKFHGYMVDNPIISPDNKKIFFSLLGNEQMELATYDIPSDKFSIFKFAGPQFRSSPAYSRDGKYITFAGGERGSKNIYIMNIDGTGLRQLTNNYNQIKEGLKETITDKLRHLPAAFFPKVDDLEAIYNDNPSFSPDGKKIIFVRSAKIRQRSMGGTMISGWDVYEVDVENGKERRLSVQNFYHIERPYYLPDGKQFLFGGIGPKNVQINELDSNRENSIIVMDGSNTSRLRSPFKHDTWASAPSVSSDETIVFVSRTNEFDGTKGKYTYDLFLHKNGKTIRLTRSKFPQIARPYISFDGSLIVFIANNGMNKSDILYRINSDGTGLTETSWKPSWLEKPVNFN